jgi:hypothetical protein
MLLPSSDLSIGRIRTRTTLLLTFGISLVFAFVLLCLVSTRMQAVSGILIGEEYQSELISIGVGRTTATNMLRAGEVLVVEINFAVDYCIV